MSRTSVHRKRTSRRDRNACFLRCRSQSRVELARLPEVPVEALRGNRLVVDSREAALHEAGELVAGLLDETAIAAELGGMLLGGAPGREREDEICIFKSGCLFAVPLQRRPALVRTGLLLPAGDGQVARLRSSERSGCRSAVRDGGQSRSSAMKGV